VRSTFGSSASGSLTLEITESVLVADEETIHESLRALHDRGITLALDDFGTGYSSLEELLDDDMARHRARA
jgi:EAL domain-containing protein (putative c-di-GMP-specific phosphodiesterase class I)